VTAFTWALTPDSNTIPDAGDILLPLDGSTMFMFVDAVPVAAVNYNNCRGSVGTPPPPGVFCNDDVANIFGNPVPQPPLTTRTSNPTRFRNLDEGRGAIGANSIDTTLLANGVHTVQWSVTDSNGRVEGIGSRFFTVLNGGSITTSSSLDADSVRVHGDASQLSAYAPSTGVVWSRTGFDLGGSYENLAANARGVRAVRLPQSGRLELSLGGVVDAAYLVANDELRDLPFGTSLDRTTGHFAWTPPVGYIGTYRLAFLRSGSLVSIDVTVGETVTVSRPVKAVRTPARRR
jgi:hypothetical protein